MGHLVYELALQLFVVSKTAILFYQVHHKVVSTLKSPETTTKNG